MAHHVAVAHEQRRSELDAVIVVDPVEVVARGISVGLAVGLEVDARAEIDAGNKPMARAVKYHEGGVP